jgi:hypothetical protein
VPTLRRAVELGAVCADVECGALLIPVASTVTATIHVAFTSSLVMHENGGRGALRVSCGTASRTLISRFWKFELVGASAIDRFVEMRNSMRGSPSVLGADQYVAEQTNPVQTVQTRLNCRRETNALCLDGVDRYAGEPTHCVWTELNCRREN